MERFIAEADILVSIKKYRDSLSPEDRFDTETKVITLNDKSRAKLNETDRYSTYLAKRYDRHKKK